jgi:hypothetical protein
MYRPRHALPHRFTIPAAVALVAMVAAGLAYALAGRGEAPGPPEAAARTAVAPAASVPAASERPSPLTRCGTQYDAQAPVLRTAARSIRQWQVHVDAMNQLVSGKITLAQASRFWARTRIGAEQRVAAFRRAEDRYSQRSYDCPAPHARLATSLHGCARAVSLRGRVDAVARRAIDTWGMHIRDMERLRKGLITPQHATRMWIMSWHKGQRQIDAYRDALRRADLAERTGRCPS